MSATTTLDELRAVLLAIDDVLEYDQPNRIAWLMRVATPLIEREFGGCAGWGSELAVKGFRALKDPE